MVNECRARKFGCRQHPLLGRSRDPRPTRHRRWCESKCKANWRPDDASAAGADGLRTQPERSAKQPTQMLLTAQTDPLSDLPERQTRRAKNFSSAFESDSANGMHGALARIAPVESTQVVAAGTHMLRQVCERDPSVEMVEHVVANSLLDRRRIINHEAVEFAEHQGESLGAELVRSCEASIAFEHQPLSELQQAASAVEDEERIGQFEGWIREIDQEPLTAASFGHQLGVAISLGQQRRAVIAQRLESVPRANGERTTRYDDQAMLRKQLNFGAKRRIEVLGLDAKKGGGCERAAPVRPRKARGTPEKRADLAVALVLLRNLFEKCRLSRCHRNLSTKPCRTNSVKDSLRWGLDHLPDGRGAWLPRRWWLQAYCTELAEWGVPCRPRG